MPQPESSRQPPSQRQRREATPWPVDPAAPRPGSRSLARPTPEPKKDGAGTDGRTPTDPDGNAEQARERGKAQARAEDGDSEDTGQWVATERFSIEHELDDTLPQVPRYTDD